MSNVAEIELLPDAWGRFERAVDAAVKGGPQHRGVLPTLKGTWLTDLCRRLDECAKAEDESPFLVAEKIAQIRQQCALFSGTL
jgi:hypothetical protein